MLEQVDMPCSKMQLMKSPFRSSLLARAFGEQPVQEQVFWQVWPVEDPHWSSLFLNN